MIEYENGYDADLRDKKVCRFCLAQDTPLTNIYSNNSNAQIALSMQIMVCSSIEVSVRNSQLFSIIVTIPAQLYKHYTKRWATREKKKKWCLPLLIDQKSLWIVVFERFLWIFKNKYSIPSTITIDFEIGLVAWCVICVVGGIYSNYSDLCDWCMYSERKVVAHTHSIHMHYRSMVCKFNMAAVYGFNSLVWVFIERG